MDQPPQPPSGAATTATTQTPVPSAPASATLTTPLSAAAQPAPATPISATAHQALTTPISATAQPSATATASVPAPLVGVTSFAVAPETNRTNRLLLGVLVLLAALLLMQVGPRLWTMGRAAGMLPGPVIYAQRDSLPTQPCWLLTPEQIRNRSVDVGVGLVPLDDMRASLMQHMRTQNMSAMCAQHLEQHNMCYCLVRTNPESESLDDIREMFNLHVVDHTINRWDIVGEKLPFCRKAVLTPRARGILARYMDSDGHIREYDARGFAAYIIQSAVQAQEAEAVCADTNDQVMMAQILRNSYKREAAGALPPARALANNNNNNNNRPLQIGQ